MASTPPPPRFSEYPGESPAQEGFLLRAGSACGAGTLGAALAAIPSALRFQGPLGCSAGSAWVVLTGLTVLPMVATVALLLAARRGARSVIAQEPLRGLGLGMGLAGLSLVLFGLGAFLRATTHHHALAGATFAVVAVALAFVVLAVVGRLVVLGRDLPERGRAMVAALALVTAFVVLGGLAGRVAARAEGDPSSVRAGNLVAELLAFALSAALVSRPPFRDRRVLAVLGPPLAAGAVLLGGAALRGSPALGEALGNHAPAYGPLLRLASEWPRTH